MELLSPNRLIQNRKLHITSKINSKLKTGIYDVAVIDYTNKMVVLYTPKDEIKNHQNLTFSISFDELKGE